MNRSSPPLAPRNRRRRATLVGALVVALVLTLGLGWLGRRGGGQTSFGQAVRTAVHLPYLIVQEARTRTPPTATATGSPGTSPTATGAATGTTPPTPIATEAAAGSFEPFGAVELPPAFALNGSGTTIDSLAFWEAPAPEDTLLLVTAKGNQRVEVWQYPFEGQELPALRHASFGTDTKVNGVVVDQARDLAFIAVSEPASTVSVFRLPDLGFVKEIVAGAENLRGEPNLVLLDRLGGAQRLYVSADDVVYVYDPETGAAMGDFEPSRGLETMAADPVDQVIYIPDENDRSGVYAYDPAGKPWERDGSAAFGTNDIFDADAEGIVLYTCPADGRSDDGSGLILVADQKKGGTDFEVFERRTWDHLGAFQLEGVSNTDGVASTQQALPGYPLGLFVAVDNDASVAGVGWDRILEATGLRCGPVEEPPTATLPPTRTASPTPEPVEPTPTLPGGGSPTPSSATPTQGTPPAGTPSPTIEPAPASSRGYLTTPRELAAIRAKAAAGVEPHAANLEELLAVADRAWSYRLDATEKCSGAGDPSWVDEQKGIPRLWARALAYHLSGEERYAEEAAGILESIMTEVRVIDWDVEGRQCQLNFSWAAPELVATADLIEDYWADRSCQGPLNTEHGDTTIGTGPCKRLFQNWLAKVYYGISYTASGSMSNWGAAATNTGLHIADYLWDRPDIRLVHRQPEAIDGRTELLLSPGEAWARINEGTLRRMNGYTVDFIHDKTCDDFANGSDQHDPDRPPVKSQITELGIVPDDARRSELCNIEAYNGEYQGYPQLHLGNVIQQCELMLRRGDARCYANVDRTDWPDFRFPNPDDPTVQQTTHLKPGRGSVERGIKAILVDSGTEWRHDSALAVAYHHYRRVGPTLPGFEEWPGQIEEGLRCWQDVCFGELTHALAPGEAPQAPPTVPPPALRSAGP